MLKIIQPNEPDMILSESYASNIDQLRKYLRYASQLQGVNAEKLKSVLSPYAAYKIEI